MVSIRNTIVCLLACLMLACASGRPEARFDRLSRQYSEKSISNYQMLLGMGELFLANPDNNYIRDGYFNRMIISGYSSWVLHYFLSDRERIKSQAEQKIILFALSRGRQYHLADEFTGQFDEPQRAQLESMHALGDSMKLLNETVLLFKTADALSARARFLNALGEDEMAAIDLGATMKADPCHQEALFQKILILISQENTREIIRTLDSCSEMEAAGNQEWNAVFHKLASDIEAVKNTTIPENEKLFQLANLYVNSGFPEIAARKSAELVSKQNNNPDYLALHAFVNYRLGDKQAALKFLNEAEAITGRTSRLRSLVEAME